MRSLIKSISLKNFKGFSEEVHIDLRPITLLFGANSAGKSTILQSLQLVREVLEHGSPDVDSTLQGGKAVDLGGFRNFVHRHDTGRVIEIGFGMELGDESLPELAGDAIEDLSLADAEVWRFHETLDSIRACVSTLEVKLSMSWSDLRNEAVVSAYKLGFNSIWCVEISTGADGRQPLLRMNASHPIFLANGIEGEALFQELADWVRPRQDTEAFRTELGLTADESNGEEAPEIPPSVLLAVLEVVRTASADSPNPGFVTWLQRFKGAIPELDRQIMIPASNPESAKDIFILQAFAGFMSWMLVGPLRLLREQLEKSRYLGPLRYIPPRGFEASLTVTDRHIGAS
ncbi:AAA family ATPase [Zoogloea dura]|uniref:AAA family ATPase n=1 Tax=Zoogloea dura TaxID=2728840 RepID=A0A848GF47_9RHOO|nr:AAA family ATPase [Zoogloea dura]NML29023.1 AAA family ATPase [Zoogloea dura]